MADTNCFITMVALYVRDAERVNEALQSCPNVKEIPYNETTFAPAPPVPAPDFAP